MSSKAPPSSKPKVAIPHFPPDFHYTTLDEACQLSLLPSTTATSTDPIPIGPLTLAPTPQAFFSLQLRRDWCIGFVPHGGFLSSALIQAGLDFLTTIPTSPWGNTLSPSFRKTLSSHTHPMKLQLEYLRRAQSDTTAIIRIEARKLGTAYSILAATLYQVTAETSAPTLHHECCTGFITFTNLSISEPPSAPTIMFPPEYSIPALSSCIPAEMPPGTNQWRICADKLSYRIPPLSDPTSTSTTTGGAPGLIEQWIRWSDYPRRDRGFTPRDLGFICDMFFPPAEPLLVKAGHGRGMRWYPTLGYEVELKSLPKKKGPISGEAEWEWLFVRVWTRGLYRGRHNLMVEVWDENGEMVARAGQVALAVGGEKNAKGRGESKL